MRTTICFVFALTFVSAFAQRRPPVAVYIEGERVRFDRMQPLRVGRRVLVPMRNVFEAMGAKVGYDARRNRAIIQRGANTIHLPIGSRYAWVNGRLWRLMLPSRIRNGRVLVPIRFVAEHLDSGVTYRRLENTIVITPHDTTPSR